MTKSVMQAITKIVAVSYTMVLLSCSQANQRDVKQFDTVIINGTVFVGEAKGESAAAGVGINDGRVTFVGDLNSIDYEAQETLDASGMIVAPGFIDPHTHAMLDLRFKKSSLNVNYLTQGVTTVFVGNDGGGPVNTAATMVGIQANSPGTNVALFVGHGQIRQAVIGNEARAATDEELAEMRTLVRDAMEAGAVGLSAGLYYAPGSFAETSELIELNKEVGLKGGVYDSHLRDESAYNIGLVSAVEEAIEIGRKSGTKVHLAHIKALGTVVWGKSKEIIEIVEAAQAEGIQVTADQYPWQASGTRVSAALVPKWAMDGGTDAMIARLQDPTLKERLDKDMEEGLVIRGGPGALLISNAPVESIVGKTLKEIAEERGLGYIETAKQLVIETRARASVASFNMNEDDIRAFMVQPWVMTSSDGSVGHPRKYASFPRKYAKYVKGTENYPSVMDTGTFIYRSSGLAADTFGLCNRGYLREGYIADVVVFDPEVFEDSADFFNARVLSKGVTHLLVNGVTTIKNGDLTGQRGGTVLKRAQCN